MLIMKVTFLTKCFYNKKLTIYRHPSTPVNLPPLRARTLFRTFAQTSVHASIDTGNSIGHATRLERTLGMGPATTGLDHTT